jgi:hypothetical protein
LNHLLQKHRAGSFLSRSNKDLAKIAEMSKPVGQVHGPKNSRNFVFSSLSEEKQAKAEDIKPQVCVCFFSNNNPETCYADI